MTARDKPSGRTLVLFNYDWDRTGFARWKHSFDCDSEGFDLFSFPSNTRLAWFNMQRFVNRLQRRAERAGWQAVVSNHEQFGALAAAMLDGSGRQGIGGDHQCRRQRPAPGGDHRDGSRAALGPDTNHVCHPVLDPSRDKISPCPGPPGCPSCSVY